jgi:hypothetical protein
MKTWFTSKSPVVKIMFTLVVITLAKFNVQAQACACKTSVNVSLDATGQATVTAAMLLTDNAPTNCTGSSTVQVMLTPTGTPINGSPKVTCEHIGKTLYGKVTGGTNSCWSTIIVQDELRPTITCPTTIQTMTCAQFVSYRPVVNDNCPIGMKLDSTELINFNDCNEGLPVNVIKRVVRTYIATDKQGNKSLPCTVTIDVTTISATDYNNFTAPLAYNEAPGDRDALACNGDWPKLANQHPDPLNQGTKIGTGVPTFGVGGTTITEALQENCKIDVSFNDVVIKAGCVTKYAREWKIIDWSCAQRPSITRLQMIEVVDRVGPTIGTIANINQSTSNHACTGNVSFLAPVLADACSPVDKLTFDINIYSYPSGTAVASVKFGQSRTVTLPSGHYTADYIGYDACYNKTTRTIHVIVSDLTPPVIICKEFATVGLTTDGFAHVPASSFDNGSHDECKMGEVLVRRMDTDNCGTCDLPKFAGFKLIGEYGTGANKRYYYLSEHEVSPEVALRKSKAFGGNAVSFGTNAERTAVNNLVKACGTDISYYIGYTDLDGDNKYRWEDPKDTITMPVNILVLAPATAPVNYTYIDADANRLYRTSNDDNQRFVIEISDPCGLSSHVKFCCTDVSQTVNQMVVVRAIDAAGNFNDCMVSTVVQDKIGPTITCPANQVKDCDFVYDALNLRKDFGWPTYTDNCPGTLTVVRDSSININSCRVGSITRTWTVTDAGGRSTACTQVITFRPNPLLNYTGPTANEWPRDTMVAGCGNPKADNLSPNRLGRPIINSRACSLVAVEEPEDKVFNFNNQGSPACFKILRTWVVIDWCKFAPNRNAQNVEYPRDITYGVNAWKRTQEIKVIDNIAPKINPLSPIVSFDTFDENCEDGYVVLRATASDSCTEVLRNRYEIVTEDGKIITRSNDGNTIDASGTYPVGTHTITYIFEDKCGNLSNTKQTFRIINKKAPTITLQNGLAINLSKDSDTTASADIWASDFDVKSSHPCGYDVVLSFAPFTTRIIKGSRGQDSTILVGTPNRTYNCDSLGRRNVRLYGASLTSDGVVVSAIVTTFIDVQDNNKYCKKKSNITHNVSGRLATEDNVEIQDVMVSLVGSEKNMMSDNQGNFGFNDITVGGTYVVTPFKNDDPLNGISTLDIVMIQRHILRLAPLTSPYKMIAADVNKDGKVTSADLVELRKLILGTTSNFSSNNSWRFIDKNYTFTDIVNAQGEAFPEVYPINNIESNMVTDFISVKVGDVNGSVTSAQGNKVESRSVNNLILYSEQSLANRGQQLKVAVKSTDIALIQGLQAAWNYDQQNLTFVGVEAGVINIEENHVADLGGQVRMSWNKTNSTGLAVDDILFTMVFDVASNVDLASSVHLEGSDFSSEAYNSDNEVLSVKWNTRESKGFALYQNTPNPFKELTTIGYDLPMDMNATLTIYDLSGKVVKSMELIGVKGYNSVILGKDELRSGMLYYTIQAGEFTSTRKMIVIR